MPIRRAHRQVWDLQAREQLRRDCRLALLLLLIGRTHAAEEAFQAAGGHAFFGELLEAGDPRLRCALARPPAPPRHAAGPPACNVVFIHIFA